MASITSSKKGYRVQVYVKGLRDSATFRTKREAEAWGSRREIELADEVKKTPAEKHTFAELLRHYEEHVAPTKRGKRWELVRLDFYLRQKDLPNDKLLSEVTADDFIAWKSARLKVVANSTFNRDMNLLSACFTYGISELRWLKENPLKEVKRPPNPLHKDVVITPQQVKSMLVELGYSPAGKVITVSHLVATCMLLALRTGMRAGELCGLTWENVKRDACYLPQTKTTPRQVPLSMKALRLLDKLKGYDQTLVFGGMTTSTLDAMFRKCRERAGLRGFTFHDTRHTAATMIARYLDVLDLCKMFGWKDPKMAMVYYNPTASDIASRLNARQPFAIRGQSR